MPSIHQIATDLDNSRRDIRKEYLIKLSSHTKRNVICYYADWFCEEKNDSSICDFDLHGFMSTVHKLDKSMGLDLILHTPGGDAAATESIVVYLRSVFGNDIRAIIPHMAMSAGTMLACSCKEIVMGKHSSLGPIDPQFSGIPAIDIVNEFKKAKKELAKDPDQMCYWSILLNKYPVGIFERCEKQIELSEVLVKSWLSTNMLQDFPKLVEKVIKKLNENKISKTHSRHFDKDQCRDAGLKIIDLEDDSNLQDLVLSIHHCYMYLFNKEDGSKIIENQNGISIYHS